MKFLTVLSWMLLACSLIRAWAVLTARRTVRELLLIAKAESEGRNPIGEALITPGVTIVVCLSWIIAGYL